MIYREFLKCYNSAVTYADITTRRELEDLIAGNFIEKKLIENLTYGELEENRGNLCQ